ncbi:MAG: hypothetical protein HY830_18900 [Actinobacteria bacterium]|nr:hypothetical protein [Actinomycetota bacterium]
MTTSHRTTPDDPGAARAATAVEEPPLDALLRQRRASMRAAMGRFEDAVAAPVREDPAAWVARVAARTAVLRDVVAEHLDGTEGRHGYYAGLIAEAPRLSRAVERLVAEHRRIEAALEDVAVLVGRTLVDRSAADPLREKATELLVLLARHRQHGSDLLWEAYGFDVGGES